jgi:hypothetical protein
MSAIIRLLLMTTYPKRLTPLMSGLPRAQVSKKGALLPMNQPVIWHSLQPIMH